MTELSEPYEAASKGFHISETCGPDKKYWHVSKFQTMAELHAFEDAWRKAMISVRDTALSHAAGQEVDSLPYAVSRSLYWLTHAMVGGSVKTATVKIAWQHAENIRAYLASTPAVARSEGEGKP